MNKNNLLVKISKRTKDGVESWEGTVALPGVLPTKLTKAKSEESKFSTRSALTSAAQRLATRYGFSEAQFEGAGVEKVTSSDKTEKSRRTRKTVESNATETVSV